MKLEELHSKLKAHLKDQNEKWEHFIYSKQDGFYQGLDEINIKGSRSSEKRFKEYNLTKEIIDKISKIVGLAPSAYYAIKKYVWDMILEYI